MLNIIPVLDLKSGIAVTGQSGNRDTYKELKSIYSKKSDPIEIAYNLKKKGINEMYIADLDAIEKKGSNSEIIKKINRILPIMLDYGIEDEKSFKYALEFASKIIIGTETLSNLKELYNIYNKYPNERIIISIDIKDNELLNNELNITLDELIEELKILNPLEIILLDLSNVGTSVGFNKNLLKKFETLKKSIIIGGGITANQLKILNIEHQIQKVLIGTNLHNGKIKIK